MKSKTYFTKKSILVILFFLVFLFIVISRFSINFLEFEGDLSYLDLGEIRVSGLLLLKNKNVLIGDKSEFIKNLKEQNPEIQKIDLYAKNFSTIGIKIKNSELCCVIRDINTNKYLISLDGKVLKKLSRNQNYSNEITLTQEIDVNKIFPINSIKKVVEIENILLDKKTEIAEIKIENDKIEFKLVSDQIVIIDSDINTKNFVEKLTTMIEYLKQKNLSFKKMDFRFGNVVVE